MKEKEGVNKMTEQIKSMKINRKKTQTKVMLKDQAG